MHVTFSFAFSSRYGKTRTSNFHKVVQGQLKVWWESSYGSLYMDFVGNLLLFPALKEFCRSVKIDEVIAMSLVYYFFGTQCISFWGRFYNSDDPTNSVIALKDNGVSTRSRVNPARFISPKGKIRI